MARYIDVDKVELKGLAVFDENLDVLVPLSVVRKALQMTPTADVVPKSEVAKEIIDIIEQRRSFKEDASKGHYVDFWKGVYRGADWAYRDIQEIIEQKYTEGEND